MNDDIFDDSGLDRWLRENAGRYDNDPDPGAWDTPSNAVWEGLRADLNRRKKRRMAWWFLLPLVAGLALSGIVVFRRSEGPVRAPARQQRITLESAVSPAFQAPRPQAAAAALPPAQPTGRRVVPANGRAAASRSRQVPGVAHVWPSDAPVENRIETPFTRAFAGHTVLDETVAANRTAALRAPETARASAFPTLPLLLRDGLPRISRKALFIVSPPQTPSGLRLKAAQPGIFYTGLSGGIFYTSRMLRANGAKRPNGRESGAWAQAFGLRAGITLGRRWAFETGVQTATIHLTAQRAIRYPYPTAQEQFDAASFTYRTSAEQSIETAFGAVQMRVYISREPNRPIANQDLLELQLRTDEQARYLRLPALVRWRSNAAGPWRWGLGAGLGFNLKNGYELEITAARPNRQGVRDLSARRLRNRIEGMAPVLVDVQIDAGMELYLSPRWSLHLTPEFRYGLNSLYRNGPFRSHAVAGGLHMGLVWTVCNRERSGSGQIGIE